MNKKNNRKKKNPRKTKKAKCHFEAYLPSGMRQKSRYTPAIWAILSVMMPSAPPRSKSITCPGGVRVGVRFRVRVKGAVLETKKTNRMKRQDTKYQGKAKD
jgi:hypothetical protein